jgi:hypothetical protein
MGQFKANKTDVAKALAGLGAGIVGLLESTLDQATIDGLESALLVPADDETVLEEVALLKKRLRQLRREDVAGLVAELEKVESSVSRKGEESLGEVAGHIRPNGSSETGPGRVAPAGAAGGKKLKKEAEAPEG